jgi:hypothetical protein
MRVWQNSFKRVAKFQVLKLGSIEKMSVGVKHLLPRSGNAIFRRG